MTVPAMTRDQAAAAVKAAVAERDAIQANLLELDSSFGKQLLAGAELTGGTKRRWDATAATLGTLWQIFSAYSAVVDQAAEAAARHLGPRELAAISGLLAGRSVQLASGPAPLAGRDLADPGREDLTMATAVARMRGAFSTVTEVVSAAERVWTEVAGRLDAVGAELARVMPQAATLGDEALTGNLTAAQGKLARLRDTLNSDPLALWQPDGGVDTSGPDRLAERVTATASWPPRRPASGMPNGPWWRPWRNATSYAGCSAPTRPRRPGSAEPKTPAWPNATIGPATCSGRRPATWPQPRPR